jgi:hypothetical protein
LQPKVLRLQGFLLLVFGGGWGECRRRVVFQVDQPRVSLSSKSKIGQELQKKFEGTKKCGATKCKPGPETQVRTYFEPVKQKRQVNS